MKLHGLLLRLLSEKGGLCSEQAARIAGQRLRQLQRTEPITLYYGCVVNARKRGTMTARNSVFLTRHIGQTTYRVRVHLSETAAETMEDKILRLIRNDGLTNEDTCAILEVPQMSRQSERSA